MIFDLEAIQAFAAHFKKIRKEKGFTQEQLAFEAELALSQIARIETARINPTLSTLSTLARTMEVSLSDLLNFPIGDGIRYQRTIGEPGGNEFR